MPKIRTFNFTPGKKYEIKEEILNPDLTLSWDWDRGGCPHCGKKILVKKNYTIEKVEVLEDKDGDQVFLGYTKEKIDGRPLTMRLPDKKFASDKDMTSKIKKKSKYMKEKLSQI